MEKLKCERCGYLWWPKDPTKKPIVCPRCKSHKWQEPKEPKTGK